MTWSTLPALALAATGAGSGAAKIRCWLHAVLSGPAIQRIEESPLEELIVTNTVPLAADAQLCRKIKVLSVAHLIGEAIRRTHDEESISSLFV